MRPVVVYIDDLASDRFLLQQLLGHAEVEVHTYANIEAAAAFIDEQSNPNMLVMVDLNLTTTSGIETVRVANERWPHLPVIAVTGDEALFEYYDELLAAGADGWLAKIQWTEALIMRHIRTVLGRAGGWAYA